MAIICFVNGSRTWSGGGLLYIICWELLATLLAKFIEFCISACNANCTSLMSCFISFFAFSSSCLKVKPRNVNSENIGTNASAVATVSNPISKSVAFPVEIESRREKRRKATTPKLKYHQFRLNWSENFIVEFLFIIGWACQLYLKKKVRYIRRRLGNYTAHRLCLMRNACFQRMVKRKS